MPKRRTFGVSSILIVGILALGCGAPTTSTNLNTSNGNVTSNTTLTNSNSNASTTGTHQRFTEPNTYQGVMRLTFETVGEQQNRTSLPPIVANVARNGADRMMEFTLPTNEKVQYLEKANMKYIVLPSRKQYAELSQEALGFEVRRLMMPEQIVNQLTAIPGVTEAGEENLNGRQVIRYTYSRQMNTNTQAGTLETDSYFLIDKETGLPVRSETVSQSASGGNVQGVSGLRLVTEMTDIRTDPDPNMFNIPPDFQKIDPEQVKTQANILFQAAAAVIGQLINQAKVSPTPTASLTPPANR